MWEVLHHSHIWPSNLAKARSMVLIEGPRCPLSGVVIRLRRVHLLLSSMVLSVPLWPERVPMDLAYARPLVSWTRQYMRRTVLFSWWMDVHVLKAFAHNYMQLERALPTLLPKSSTVDANLKTGVTIRLLYNKGILYYLEHSWALPGIGVLLSKRVEVVCSSDRTEKLWIQYFKLVANITFRNGATWWLTHSDAQCTTYHTIPTPSFIPSPWTISSRVPVRDAKPGKHHGTRWIPQVPEALVLHFTSLSPCRNIQRSSYRKHTQVPVSQ